MAMVHLVHSTLTRVEVGSCKGRGPVGMEQRLEGELGELEPQLGQKIVSEVSC